MLSFLEVRDYVLDASIIIRAFNEEEHLPRLFEEINAQQTSYEFETVLVDSGSTDNTVEIAEQFDARIFHIEPEEFTFGYSLNYGIEHARGDVCIIISAHCYPASETWLDNLVRHFEDDNVALVYGRQIGNHMTRFSEHQIFAQWFPEESIRFQETPFCNNANAAIARGIWEKQPYDESLTGLEDLDWASKALSRGYDLHYEAAAPVYHVHDETSAQVFNRYKREAIAFKAIFPGEKFTILDFTRFFLSNTFSDYIHATQEGELLQHLLDIPRFRFLQFWGTYQGYRFNEAIDKRLKQRFYYPRKPELLKKERGPNELSN